MEKKASTLFVSGQGTLSKPNPSASPPRSPPTKSVRGLKRPLNAPLRQADTQKLKIGFEENEEDEDHDLVTEVETGGNGGSVIAECLRRFRKEPALPREERERLREKGAFGLKKEDFWWTSKEQEEEKDEIEGGGGLQVQKQPPSGGVDDIAVNENEEGKDEDLEARAAKVLQRVEKVLGQGVKEVASEEREQMKQDLDQYVDGLVGEAILLSIETPSDTIKRLREKIGLTGWEEAYGVRFGESELIPPHPVEEDFRLPCSEPTTTGALLSEFNLPSLGTTVSEEAEGLLSKEKEEQEEEEAANEVDKYFDKSGADGDEEMKKETSMKQTVQKDETVSTSTPTANPVMSPSFRFKKPGLRISPSSITFGEEGTSTVGGGSSCIPKHPQSPTAQSLFQHQVNFREEVDNLASNSLLRKVVHRALFNCTLPAHFPSRVSYTVAPAVPLNSNDYTVAIQRTPAEAPLSPLPIELMSDEELLKSDMYDHDPIVYALKGRAKLLRRLVIADSGGVE